MTLRERVTIDITVARDILELGRRRHALAMELCGWAQAGDVELAVAPQGHRLDADADGDLGEQLRAMFADEGIAESRQLAYPSPVTYPSPDLSPGQYVAGFGEAWEKVAATWGSHDGKEPPGIKDQLHIETHVMEGRDVFITDDGALRAMCRRLRDEHNVPVTAMRLEEYLDARRPGRT